MRPTRRTPRCRHSRAGRGRRSGGAEEESSPPSLRGAERRSNPVSHLQTTGLLRFARNDGYCARVTDDTTITGAQDWQHWALVMARVNQMIMEAWADNLSTGSTLPGFGFGSDAGGAYPMQWMSAGAEAW